MISQLQAFVVKNDLTDLPGKLAAVDIKNLVLPEPLTPQEMVKVAEWPEERTEWLAQYARRVSEFGKYGKFRQRGAYSSFCLPDKDIKDRVWKDREGNRIRSDYYHHLQREERRALEQHARAAGCKLIIYPKLDLIGRGPKVRPTRLRTLLEFLEEIPDDKCEVIISKRAFGGNLAIVGDWFVAESRAPRMGGYVHTVFDWHASRARRAAKKFDREMESLYKQKGLSLEESLKGAKEEIKKIIEEDEAKLKDSKIATCPACGHELGPGESPETVI
jgi:hypothetical protein